MYHCYIYQFLLMASKKIGKFSKFFNPILYLKGVPIRVFHSSANKIKLFEVKIALFVH